MTRYEMIHKEKVEYEILERYKLELAELTTIGFDDVHHTREVIFPFSALLLFFLYPALKFGKEIVRIEKPLRYVLLNPLVLNHQYDSYAHVFGMGTKFITHFSDDTLLITCSYPTENILKPKKQYFRYGQRSKIGVSAAWQQHQERILDLEQKGRETVQQLSLEYFEKMMHRDDKMMLGWG
jgi:hypothetical protein